MLELNFAKRLSYVLAASTLIFALSACSPKTETPATPVPSAAESAQTTPEPTPAPEPLEAEATPEPGAEEAAAEDKGVFERLVSYENKDFGLSMSFPGEWGEPAEIVNENGLSVLGATEEFDNSIIVLVRDIPSETPTLEVYQEENTNNLAEYYDPSMVKMNEIVKLDGQDFLKIIIEADGEPYQVLYTSFGNTYAYEIVMTLMPDYQKANADLFADIENSIRLDK